MTELTSYTENDLPPTHPRRQIRDMSKDEFILKFGSGTLRKSLKLGFDIQEAYLNERSKFEFGAGFEIIQRSRVTYSDIKLISSASLTELGWHAERMIELRPFESDVFVCKQFEIEYANNIKKEGAGILIQETSAPWIPKGYMVFSVVAEIKFGKYLPAINPF
jgi:hypothetical protein